MESDFDALNEAQALFLDLIFDQQIADVRRGLPATNTVEVKRLSRTTRSRLRAALQSVEQLEEMTRDFLFKYLEAGSA